MVVWRIISGESHLIEVQLFTLVKEKRPILVLPLDVFAVASGSTFHSGNVCKANPIFIRSTIRDSFKIPFISTPPRFWCKKNRSSLDNCVLLQKLYRTFIQDGKITEVRDLNNICPLSVSIQPPL